MNIYDKILSLTNMSGCATFADHICSMRRNYAIRASLSGDLQTVPLISGEMQVAAIMSGDIQSIPLVGGIVQKIEPISGELFKMSTIKGEIKCQQ